MPRASGATSSRLSSYARQFLGQMEKPDVDFIEGLSPAISIDQKCTSRNPRSTVGTITEIYDYLRVLYARVGHPHCPKCGRPMGRQTPDQIVDQVMRAARGHALPGAGADRARPEGRVREAARRTWRRKGFARARIDGEIHELTEQIRLDRYFKHDIEVIVDRLVAKPDIRRRVADSRRDGAPARRGHGLAGRAGRRRRRGRDVQPEARVHVRRHLLRRAGAAQLLVQLAVRRVPDLRRPRHPARGRPGARSCPTRPVARRGRDRRRGAAAPTEY